MLAATNSDMKSYWCNEVFAKVFSYLMGYTLYLDVMSQIHYYLVLKLEIQCCNDSLPMILCPSYLTKLGFSYFAVDFIESFCEPSSFLNLRIIIMPTLPVENNTWTLGKSDKLTKIVGIEKRYFKYVFFCCFFYWKYFCWRAGVCICICLYSRAPMPWVTIVLKDSNLIVMFSDCSLNPPSISKCKMLQLISYASLEI